MKAITNRWQLHFSLQNALLLLAAVLGALAITYDYQALLNGMKLVWDNSGYASLALAPLTLLLATAVLRDGTDRKPDRKSLDRHYAIVASISPMAGFLGTVLGIMGAVQTLGSADNAESLIQMVDQIFSRMGIAFTTTAWGLVLGMIAVLMLRLKKELTGPDRQMERMITILQQIESDLNDIRPVARRQVIEEHRNGGRRYETIDL